MKKEQHRDQQIEGCPQTLTFKVKDGTEIINPMEGQTSWVELWVSTRPSCGFERYCMEVTGQWNPR